MYGIVSYGPKPSKKKPKDVFMPLADAQVAANLYENLAYHGGLQEMAEAGRQMEDRPVPSTFERVLRRVHGFVPVHHQLNQVTTPSSSGGKQGNSNEISYARQRARELKAELEDFHRRYSAGMCIYIQIILVCLENPKKIPNKILL